MAVIFTYPQKSTLVSGDLFLISDSEDENKTKNTSITSIKDAINVVDSLNALTGTVTLTGGTNVTLNTSGNNIVINAAGGVPGGITGSVQFKNSSSQFAGDAGFTLTLPAGAPKLTIGDFTQDAGGTVEIQSDENGGILRIGGGSQLYYTTIQGSENDTANYNIILPTAGPGGNNKILESSSTGALSWINTPSVTTYTAGTNIAISGTNVISATNTTYTASTGLTLTGTVFSSNTVGTQSNLANTASSVAGRSYPIQTGAASGTVGSNHLIVNIPWTDTTYTAGSNVSISGTNVISSVDNNTTYTASTGIVLTGTVFKADINPITQGIPANNNSSTLGRTYRIQADSQGKLVVNVPWTSSSTLTAGTGLTLTGTVFSANTTGTQGSMANVSSNVSGRSYVIQTGTANGTTGSDNLVVNVPWTDNIVTSLTTTGTGAATLTSGVLDIPTVTASQGLTKTSNDITLDIADPTNGWAILGGGAGTTTPVIFGSAGANATGNKNFGITSFISSSTVTSADQNTAVGFDSMGGNVTTASRNVAIGFAVGNSMTTALDSVLVGFDAGKGITVGDENTIIGSNAGETITTGTRNTIIGASAIAYSGAASSQAGAIGRSATATSLSVAVGTGASVTGDTGTAIGDAASVTASNGIAIGKGCTVSGSVLGLASSGNPIDVVNGLTDPEIASYLTVVVNGVTRYIALYSGTP